MKKWFLDLFKKIDTYIHQDKKVFASGLCFEKLLFIFIIGCLIGTYYEQIVNFLVHYKKDGSIYWSTRRGVIYGPLSPIYGAGFVLMEVLLGKKKLKDYQIFLIGALIGGVFEYVVSFLQETFVGTISWDYTGYFLNINGRTTVPYMCVWGLLCLFVIKKAYPFFSRLIEKIPYNLGKILTIFFTIFLSLDMLISWSALIRQDFRRKGVREYTIIDKFYDRFYPDSYLKKFYPMMRVRSR